MVGEFGYTLGVVFCVTLLSKRVEAEAEAKAEAGAKALHLLLLSNSVECGGWSQCITYYNSPLYKPFKSPFST